MLSSVTNKIPKEIETRKSGPNTSKEKTNTELYTSESEEIDLKYKSKDGDVLELNVHRTKEMYSHSESSSIKDYKDSKDAKKVKEKSKEDSEVTDVDSSKNAWKGVREWAQQISDELKQQQLELLKDSIKNSDRTVDAGNGKYFVLFGSFADKLKEAQNNIDPTQATPEEEAIVPEYWNAENTSDRIVRMATGFAKVSGLSPKEFGETIKNAIQKGFDSAHDETGDLPGAAGKLNRDTYKLTFEKLTKWLDEWETTSYNQSAKQAVDQTTTGENRGT